MRLEQSPGFVDAVKTTSYSSPRCHETIAYKRRKISQILKAPDQIFLSNEATLVDEQARVVHNWRSVIEQIVESTGLGHGCPVHGCIQKALSHGPVGFSDKKKCEDKLSKEQGEVVFHEFKNWTKDQGDADCITTKCQNALFDILTSHKFALLCDLLCKCFQVGNVKIISDLNLVISKMKDGVYKQSMEHFNQDIQLVWENFQKAGQEMTYLASSLLSSSQASCQKQIAVKENSGILDSTSQSICGTEQSAEEQTDSSYLDKISICKQCSLEAHGRNCLVCDGCEAMFHITCIKPAVEEINTRSWYCAACSKNREPSEPDMTVSHLKSWHRNCVVCRRLEELESWGYFEKTEVGLVDSSRECSVSDMEIDSRPSRTAILQLCKLCGQCEEGNKRFIICSNRACFYKYYHIQCLKESQVASDHQSPNRWYCPSCLCRTCLIDRDDELICLCDGCDEAYHTYCMNPPRGSIPKGRWYCFNCNLVRIRKGMRMFEQSLLQKHGQNDMKLVNGVKRSMDMLVSAAEKLSTEERLVKANVRGK